MLTDSQQSLKTQKIEQIWRAVGKRPGLRAEAIFTPLILALFEWARKAELSADRAALLVTDNREANIRLLMKLAGGSRYVSSMIEEDEFVNQARQFEELTKGDGLNRFYRFAANLRRTHPFAVLRAYELNTWAQSQDYETIRAGDYQRRIRRVIPDAEGHDRSCPQCHRPLLADMPYCEKCGHPVNKCSSQYDSTGTEEFMETMKGGVDRIRRFFSGQEENADDDPGLKRRCPQCGKVYRDVKTRFCPKDGARLSLEWTFR